MALSAKGTIMRRQEIKVLICLMVLGVSIVPIRAQKTSVADVFLPLIMSDFYGFKAALKKWERSESDTAVRKKHYDAFLARTSAQINRWKDPIVRQNNRTILATTGGLLMGLGLFINYAAYDILHTSSVPPGDLFKDVILAGGLGWVCTGVGIVTLREALANVHEKYDIQVNRIMGSYIKHRIKESSDKSDED